jgi:retron-type reverse transcriptase
MHLNQKNVLNLDLKDFFDSFNFGRVRGFFIKNKNFELDDSIATVIAQIACHNNGLPQGSPCSPVITNLITHSLDIRLAKLAKKCSCTYSRYADDITFSTRKNKFSTLLVNIDETYEVSIGKKLRNEIERAGFKINYKKTRSQFKDSRQDVTGLVVNKKVNIKSDYWRLARAKCNQLFSTGTFLVETVDGMKEGNINQLEGQLNFIDSIDKYNHFVPKGKCADDFRYELNRKRPHYFSKLNVREKTFSKFLYYKSFYRNVKPTILTEGKTDPIYLKAAIHQLASDFPLLASEEKNTEPYLLLVDFFRYTDRTGFLLDLKGGGSYLKDFVKNFSRNRENYGYPLPSNPIILVLDNDGGPEGLLKLLKGNPNCPDDLSEMRAKNFMHLMDNLYLVLTPLKADDSFTNMEDLFDQKTLNIPLGDKKFAPDKETNTETSYGKAYFAKYVIQKRKSRIDFDGFKPTLDRVVAAIEHYQTIRD